MQRTILRPSKGGHGDADHQDLEPCEDRDSNAKIAMYANDHVPPHFHLLGPNSEAQIRLDTLTVLQGTADRRDLGEAVAWAKAHMATLQAEWSRLNER